MSVMKSSSGKPVPSPGVFTVRDLNRDTAKVLEACRQRGRVLIRHRSGEQFAITPVESEDTAAGPRADFVERMAIHRERMRAMGVRGPKLQKDIERLNRLIAGEE